MNETRVLGDYRVVKQIGQGPLGTVLLAEHRFLKTPYALKVLPEELSSDRSFIQRFEEEVSLLASLDHPHIVKIHNISFAQGVYFLVTDCVVDELGETTNLSQYLNASEKTMEEAELIRLLQQLAEAIDYAHSNKGIAHRGIKLNNVLVRKGKTGIELSLSDFGLSRIIGSGAVISRTYKMVSEALGVAHTIHRYPTLDNSKLSPLHASFLQNYTFLAPEQKKLDGSADVKADIYAFGVLAYFLMMGEYPEGVFPMPSERLQEGRIDWDQLVRQCLQNDPQRRPDALTPLLETRDSLKDKSIPIAKEKNTPGTPSLKPILRVATLERPNTDLDPAAAFHIDTTVKQYQPERKEVKNVEPLMTEMIIINGGNFLRGSNSGNRDEMPRHEVQLDSFAIDTHPVTNEQFVRFLDVMGGEKDTNHNDIIRMRDSRIKRSGGRLSIESGYARHPVVGVTWYGAIAYAKWVGKRLPTEAEWEVAARGGLENSLYPTGDEIEKSQANFFSADTTAVMSYAPNGYGLYDMAGNVYEWCYDWYGYNSYEAAIQEPENPKGPLQGVYRVLRGGCWKSLKEDLRCSKRHRNNPGTVNGTYGFRCAADVE